jgi:hypothetical protein
MRYGNSYQYSNREKARILEMVDMGWTAKDIAREIRGDEMYADSIQWVVRGLVRKNKELFPFEIKDINGAFLTQMLRDVGITRYGVGKNYKTRKFIIYDKLKNYKVVRVLTGEHCQAYLLVKEFIGELTEISKERRRKQLESKDNC